MDALRFFCVCVRDVFGSGGTRFTRLDMQSMSVLNIELSMQSVDFFQLIGSGAEFFGA